ncbi:MAG: Dabb family protein [Geminicoccaceae bacterium]
MIRHIVLLKARSDLRPGELEAVFAELAGLKKVLPGFRAMSAGPDLSPEGIARGYTHGFTMDFADTAARDAYLVHPDHISAGGRLCACAEGGRDGVLVVDLEV